MADEVPQSTIRNCYGETVVLTTLMEKAAHARPSITKCWNESQIIGSVGDIQRWTTDTTSIALPIIPK